MNKESPSVSLVILTYNHERFIRETIEGALSQSYENLEIIISDDASTDATFEIVEKMVLAYRGPHRIKLNRNGRNLGLVPHVNRLMSDFVSGEYVMLHGGDDVCLPQTIEFGMERLLRAGVDSMAFNTNIIDEKSKFVRVERASDNSDDVIYKIDDYLTRRIKTSGAVRIFKYDIFRTFGPMQSACPTEDSTNLLRTFLYGSAGYCPVPNLNYRLHGNNLSGAESVLTRFDPMRISEQYETDLKTAIDKALITRSAAKRVARKIGRYRRREIAQRTVYAVNGRWHRIAKAFSYLIKLGYTPADVHFLIRRIKKWQKGAKRANG